MSSSGAGVNKHSLYLLVGSEGKLTIIAQKMSVLSGRGSVLMGRFNVTTR